MAGNAVVEGQLKEERKDSCESPGLKCPVEQQLEV
jgi:hypothetical protein